MHLFLIYGNNGIITICSLRECGQEVNNQNKANTYSRPCFARGHPCPIKGPLAPFYHPSILLVQVWMMGTRQNCDSESVPRGGCHATSPVLHNAAVVRQSSQWRANTTVGYHCDLCDYYGYILSRYIERITHHADLHHTSKSVNWIHKSPDADVSWKTLNPSCERLVAWMHAASVST